MWGSMKSKIKAMKSKQEISDEEIQRFMDFDKLLKEKEMIVARQKFLRTMKIFGSAAGIVILGLITILIFKNQPPVEPEQKGLAKPTIESNRQDSDLSIAGPSRKVENLEQTDSEITPKAEIKRDNNTEKAKSATSNNELTEQNNGNESESVNDESESSQAKIVYQQAEPVNGYPDLYAYFDKELTYPPASVKDSIQGVVTVVFIVNASGKAEDAKIENSLGQLFDEEVLRVLENMPRWKPAYYNGKPVKSKVSLPLTFQIMKVSTKK